MQGAVLYRGGQWRICNNNVKTNDYKIKSIIPIYGMLSDIVMTKFCIFCFVDKHYKRWEYIKNDRWQHWIPQTQNNVMILRYSHKKAWIQDVQHIVPFVLEHCLHHWSQLSITYMQVDVASKKLFNLTWLWLTQSPWFGVIHFFIISTENIKSWASYLYIFV